MVLFFLLKPVFGTALLRLHRFQAFAGGFDTTPNFWLYTVFKKECLPPGFSAGCRIIPFNVRRKVEIENNVELIPTINIYPADKLIDNHFLCFKTGTVIEIRKRNQFFVQFWYPCNDFDWIGGRCKGRSNPFGTRQHSNHPANLCTWYRSDGKPFCWYFWTGDRTKETVIRKRGLSRRNVQRFNPLFRVQCSMVANGW